MVLLSIILDLTSSFDKESKPLPALKKLSYRPSQETKRHSSLQRSGTSTSSYVEPYLLQYHRDGVSTPPLTYYAQSEFMPYYNLYSANSYVQNFAQPLPSYPNPAYFQGYVDYQGYQEPQDYYQSTVNTSKKKSAKPSQFRPPPSKQTAFGAHNAENEKDIVAIINEYATKGNDLSNLKGKVIELVVTQTGSRFLQKQLTKSSPEFITFILQEIEKELPKLMIDNYANYFCQKLILSCSQPQRISFIEKVI